MSIANNAANLYILYRYSEIIDYHNVGMDELEIELCT